MYVGHTRKPLEEHQVVQPAIQGVHLVAHALHLALDQSLKAGGLRFFLRDDRCTEQPGAHQRCEQDSNTATVHSQPTFLGTLNGCQHSVPMVWMFTTAKARKCCEINVTP
jgi:hypothetical protein